MAIFNKLTTNYRFAMNSTCFLRRGFTTKNIPTVTDFKAEIKKVTQKILPNIKITNPSVLASMAAYKNVTTKLQTWTKTESGQNRIKDGQAITKLFLALCLGLIGSDYYKHCKNQTIATDKDLSAVPSLNMASNSKPIHPFYPIK